MGDVVDLYPSTGNSRCDCGDEWLRGGAVVLDHDGSVTGRSMGDWSCASCGQRAPGA